MKNYTLQLFLLLTLTICLHSCSSEPSTKIVSYVEKNGAISYPNEEMVCDLIPLDIVNKYLPYKIEKPSYHPLNLQLHSMYGAGCSFQWQPPAGVEIDKKKIDSYTHAGYLGSINLKILSKYSESIDNWMDILYDKDLSMNSRGDVQFTEEMKYRGIDGIGDRAIWNESFSYLKWNITDELYFNLQVKYPLSAEERYELAVELSEHISQHALDGL